MANSQPFEIKMDIRLGTHINEAAQDAVNLLAGKTDSFIRFKFNDVEFDVTPSDTASDIVDRWQAFRDREKRDYESSPQFAIDQAHKAALLAERQTALDLVMVGMPEALRSGLSSTVKWCGEFVLASDWGGLVCDRDEVVLKLEAAGYVSDEGVGMWLERLDTGKDRALRGRWIIGQVISGLKSEHICCPPLLSMFAAEYVQKGQTDA